MADGRSAGGVVSLPNAGSNSGGATSSGAPFPARLRFVVGAGFVEPGSMCCCIISPNMPFTWNAPDPRIAPGSKAACPANDPAI
jgi:hypothetical protein